MYQHYHTNTVSGDELDRLIASARAESDRLGFENGPHAVLVERADADPGTSRAEAQIDSSVCPVFDVRSESMESEGVGWDPVPGLFILWTARKFGVALGVIHEAPGRTAKVVSIDEQMFRDLWTWTRVAMLPDQAFEMYQRLAAERGR